MMASVVRRSKHALPSAQHPTPMTILSTEGRYGIIEPWEHEAKGTFFTLRRRVLSLL